MKEALEREASQLQGIEAALARMLSSGVLQPVTRSGPVGTGAGTGAGASSGAGGASLRAGTGSTALALLQPDTLATLQQQLGEQAVSAHVCVLVLCVTWV